MINRRQRKLVAKRNSPDYHRQVFLARVHQLLDMGYHRTNMHVFRSYEETAITGELVRAMDSVIDDPGSPRWVRQFQVHDDPPVNAPGRLGKARRRLDIKVISSHRLPRSRFSFEAKRLGTLNPVSGYLGHEGLGRFLSGDYAAEELQAGMLGYVQNDSPEEWAAKIADRISQSPEKLRLVPGTPWTKHPFRGGPSYSYHTRHSRAGNPAEIDIYHTLLRCYA